MDMSHSLRVLARVFVGFAVAATALLASAYVLDLVSGEEAKEMLVKTILVVSIIGVACGILLVLGTHSNKPRQ